MLLSESARILDIDTMDLIREEGLIIVVDETSFSGAASHVRVNLFYRNDVTETASGYVRNLPPPIGAVSADVEPMFGTGYEDDTFVVYKSSLRHDYRDKGIGALLYNVLLAQISRDKNWLASDRESVSNEAMRIWDKWNEMPAAYDIDQMDMKPWGEEYFLTPEPDDDARQTSFYNNIGRYDGGRSDKEKYKKAFIKSGLTKRFRMKDPKSFLRDLEEYGILRYADS